MTPCRYCLCTRPPHAKTCPRPRCPVPGCTRTARKRDRWLCQEHARDGMTRAMYARPLPDRQPRRPEDRESPRPARRPGDAPHPCFWCGHWRCQAIFKLCPDCQAEYDHRSRTMPEEKAQEEKAGVGR